MTHYVGKESWDGPLNPSPLYAKLTNVEPSRAALARDLAPRAVVLPRKLLAARGVPFCAEPLEPRTLLSATPDFSVFYRTASILSAIEHRLLTRDDLPLITLYPDGNINLVATFTAYRPIAVRIADAHRSYVAGPMAPAHVTAPIFSGKLVNPYGGK